MLAMNEKQRTLLLCLAIAFGATLLFPPFKAEISGITFNGGYQFILTPKEKQDTVNVLLLLTEWAGICLIGSALWFFLKK
jgi:hypothetical protein